MSDTKEIALQWSGYVCPDCRFVFRVPTDHDGQGGLCPGCRHLLRIPGLEETLPPLVVPPDEDSSEANLLGSEKPQMTPLRREKMVRNRGDQLWDKEPKGVAISGGEESRQLFWMLIGGVILFSLMVGLVLLMLGDGDATSRQPAGPMLAIVPEPVAIDPVSPAGLEEVAAFITEAKLLAGRFLEARRIEEMLPLVRNPQVVEAKMRDHYAGAEIKAPGLKDFMTDEGIYRSGSSFDVRVRTRDYQERTIIISDTPEGLKIDWESWVGWSEMPWEEFIASKPTTGKLFRVLSIPVSYYNFLFSDEKKWNAYRLESPNGEMAVYGYVERGSELDLQLRGSPDEKQAALILSIKFPADGKTDNQVIIENVIANGWLLETGKTP